MVVYLQFWAIDWLQYGIISSLGSLVYYLYQIRKGNEHWEFKSAFIHICMGFFVANLVADFIPVKNTSIFLIVGYSAYAFLGNLETYGSKLISTFLVK